MPRLLISSCALALALVPLARASAPPVTRSQALAAVRLFEANTPANLAPRPENADPVRALESASRTLTRYAVESDDVVVDLGPDALPWRGARLGLEGRPADGERGLLLVAYLCGSIRAQLSAGHPDANPLAGWTEMLAVYRALRLQGAARIADVESLLARQADGSLAARAAEALDRSRERLRRTYGSADAPRGPLVTASQP